jgi:4-hydroxybenzoate polyprenyltransferase
MTTLSAWIHIVRPVNLFIVALTQYSINIFLLIPNFETYGILFSLDAFHFFLLVLSTTLVCAAGYLINDYFDIEADKINKPQKQFAGSHIAKKKIYISYLIINAIGLSIGAYVAHEAGNVKLVTIHCITIVLLYFYSYAYKRITLLGNIIVSILTVLSILIVGVFEPHLYNLQREGDYYIAGLIWKYLIGISIFAFLLTLVREIIKDAEDMEGDNHAYVKSVAIVWGLSAVRGICTAIFLVVLAGIVYITFFGVLKGEKLYIAYSVILMSGIIYCGYKTLLAKTKQEFHTISTYIKILMFIGIIFLPLYYIVNFTS